jgi:hypothetical protein
MHRLLATCALVTAACGSSAPAGDSTSRVKGDAAAEAADASGTSPSEDGSAGLADAVAPRDASDAGGSASDAPDAADGGFVSMGCMGVDPGNTDPAHAVSFAIDTPFLGCLKNGLETRYEDFTTPASPGAGGYVVLTFSDVGPTAIEAHVYAASDMSFAIFEMLAARDGDGLVYWFAAAPSTEYVVSVQDEFGDTSNAPYTLTPMFMPADDPSKPNDSEATATPITLGTPVQSLAMHGYTSSDSLSDPGWISYFQVDLGSTPATVSVTNVPAEIAIEAQIYGNANEGNGSLAFGLGSSKGASLSVTTTEGIVPGPHYVVIEPQDNPNPYGQGSTPASYVTNPYTLVVSQ